MRTDAELLQAYAAGDQAAFAALVQRHAGMVERSCRRLLGDDPEVEDAAQAVFLVLARGGPRRQAALAAWLHETTRRTAAKIWRDRRRRRRREEAAALRRQGRQAEQEARAAAAEVLDEALAALPARQREALVLRYLEGRGQEEAAALAGCPTGTISARASRGLETLRARLGARGAILSAAGLAALLSAEAQAAAAAGALPSLVAAGLSAAGVAAHPASGKAILLAEGVLKAMFWTKVKLAAMVSAAIILAGALLPPALRLAAGGQPAGRGSDVPGPAAGSPATPATTPAATAATGLTGGTPAPLSGTLRERLAAILAGAEVPQDLLLTVWRREPGDRSAVQHLNLLGRGFGLWGNSRQYPADRAHFLAVLGALQRADFCAMPDHYGDVPIEERAQANPGGLRLQTGGVAQGVVLYPTGGAAGERAAFDNLLRELLRLGRERAEAEGIGAASLEDGLQKVLRGGLAVETLRVSSSVVEPLAGGITRGRRFFAGGLPARLTRETWDGSRGRQRAEGELTPARLREIVALVQGAGALPAHVALADRPGVRIDLQISVLDQGLVLTAGYGFADDSGDPKARRRLEEILSGLENIPLPAAAAPEGRI